jgi:hypothetical protein
MLDNSKQKEYLISFFFQHVWKDLLQTEEERVKMEERELRTTMCRMCQIYRKNVEKVMSQRNQ